MSKPPAGSGDMSLASQAMLRSLKGNGEAPFGTSLPSSAQASPADLAPGPSSSPAPKAAQPGPAGQPGTGQPGRAADRASSEGLALNLARRPFVNSRPVTRLAIVLWVLGALLLAGNVSLFWNYLGSSEQERAALGRTARKIAEERQRGAQLDAGIAGLNLDQQNREVAYLNRKIAERTFSWSLLFDRLAEVLPDGVRLTQLVPQGLAEKEQPSRYGPITSADKTTPVTVQIQGEAKNNEALFQFVERLFAHPAFADPDLGRQEREETGLLRFDLKVKYLPAASGTTSGGGK